MNKKEIKSFDGQKIPYVFFEGGKTPIIFLHALGFDYSYWNKSLYYFSKKSHFVLAPTLRGHTQRRTKLKKISIVDHVKDLRTIIEKLKIKKPILVGCSLGGRVVADYSKKYPKEISKVFCINSPLEGFNESVRFYLKFLVAISKPFVYLDFVKRFMNPDFSKSRITNNVFMFLKGLLRNNGFGLYLNYLCLRKTDKISVENCVKIVSNKDEVFKNISEPDYYIEGNHNCPVSHSKEINKIIGKCMLENR